MIFLQLKNGNQYKKPRCVVFKHVEITLMAFAKYTAKIFNFFRVISQRLVKIFL